MDKSNKMAGYGIAVAMLIVGGMAGYAVGNSMSDNSTKSSVVATSNTKAADLRATLVAAGVEHMLLTNQAIDGALDGSPNATQSATAR